MSFESVSNPPDASALMTSARSFGNYDLARALADLLDNSITAGANTIRITCFYNSGEPEIRVWDDGCGMSQEELKVAMRPASANPDKERAPEDLGRFGWGMKSASFSQCRLFTVATKKLGCYSAASWDLDKIDDWRMRVYAGDAAEKLLKEAMQGDSGTEIIWQKCDRLSERSSLTQDQFNEIIVHARRKLALVFHRFISGKSGARKVSILINETPLESFDPFYSEHKATQEFPEEIRESDNTKIVMRAYILPHYTKLGANEYEKLGGEEGYVKNQGFYVYRNNRLIIHGTWFRLAKHGELSKLVRISIDIPNSLDSIWKVTIDKSDAQLPSSLRARMKGLIDQFRNSSTKAIRSKGGKLSDGKGVASVWERYARNQQIIYRLNRSHPLLKFFGDAFEAERKAGLENILKLIEQEVPIDALSCDASANPQKLNQAVSDPIEFKKFVRQTVPILLADGVSEKDVIDKLRNSEPYFTHWSIVEEYLEERGII